MEVATMSNTKNLVLGVTLDHEDGICRAQRWLKGKVILSVVGERTCANGHVTIELLGKETTWSSRSSCMGNSSTEKSRVIFQERDDLHEFSEEELDINIYSYPFSVFLPGSIAPSMELDDAERGGGCSICYRLRASLGPGLYTDRAVKIVGATLSKTHPYTLVPTCISSKSSDGTVADTCLVIAAKVDNTHVGKGQSLGVSLACRNLSRADIKRVDVLLVEEISWTAPSWSHGKTHTNTLASIRDVALSGLVKKAEDPERVRIWKGSKGHPHGTIRVNNMLRSEMHSDVSSQRNRMEIKIPNTARDSYEGSSKQLITIKHALKVILVTRDKASDPPQVSIPIKILDPPMTVTDHHHHRVVSSEKVAEVATTVWPKDSIALNNTSDGAEQDQKHPAPEEENSDHSCPMIQEVPQAE